MVAIDSKEWPEGFPRNQNEVKLPRWGEEREFIAHERTPHPSNVKT